MFLIAGITQKQEKLDLNKVKTCLVCGQNTHFNAYMEYQTLSIFFIPTIKWNKKYYLTTSCCGSVFQIPDDIGRDIEKGDQVVFYDDDLIPIFKNTNKAQEKKCIHCGFSTKEDYTYCPKCGKRM